MSSSALAVQCFLPLNQFGQHSHPSPLQPARGVCVLSYIMPGSGQEKYILASPVPPSSSKAALHMAWQRLSPPGIPVRGWREAGRSQEACRSSGLVSSLGDFGEPPAVPLVLIPPYHPQENTFLLLDGAGGQITSL